MNLSFWAIPLRLEEFVDIEVPEEAWSIVAAMNVKLLYRSQTKGLYNACPSLQKDSYLS